MYLQSSTSCTNTSACFLISIYEQATVLMVFACCCFCEWNVDAGVNNRRVTCVIFFDTLLWIIEQFEIRPSVCRHSQWNLPTSLSDSLLKVVGEKISDASCIKNQSPSAVYFSAVTHVEPHVAYALSELDVSARWCHFATHSEYKSKSTARM